MRNIDIMADALKREGDGESTLQHYRDGYWLPIAERLTAKGWRPPPQLVTDHDTLTALPRGSVVLHTPCPTGVCVWTNRALAWEWKTNGATGEFDCCDLFAHMSEGDRLLVIHTPELDYANSHEVR